MTNHYFSEKPISTGKQTTITTIQFNTRFTFKSQSGIFSWKEIDKGSELLINKLELPQEKEAKILDLGCGYGFIGIVLAKMNPSKTIFLSDINELAIKMTMENCLINNVQKNTRVFQGNLFKPYKDQLFNLIVTNPPILAGKKVLQELIGQSYEQLQGEGSIQLVVPKKKGLISIQKILSETYNDFSVLGKGGGFWVLKADKA